MIVFLIRLMIPKTISSRFFTIGMRGRSEVTTEGIGTGREMVRAGLGMDGWGSVGLIGEWNFGRGTPGIGTGTSLSFGGCGRPGTRTDG
ncbi:hypothetical protein B0O99DRAFT_627235 [Bisporella sp. PMI_857]|nr:hypothetical protein B0O99DRAFT_627235 [Bisporella sp. PMI_857]